jgi:hypothetical protein
MCLTKRSPFSVVSQFSGPPLPWTMVRTIEASARKLAMCSEAALAKNGSKFMSSSGSAGSKFIMGILNNKQIVATQL